MSERQDSLPPGWECKLDGLTGKQYYINHATKTTTWDDPRGRRSIHATPKHFEQIPLQEFRSASRSSPLLLRGAKIQDSSLTIQQETDDAVGKISAMFPTVSDTHIRLLMKNCRYMKSIYPRADETVILDILYNNDSNIQKASEILSEMGFERKDTVKIAQQKMEMKTEAIKKQEEVKTEVPDAAPPKVKTTDEKATLTEKMKRKYEAVADHLITIALESVDFDENRANQILEIIMQEDSDKKEEENGESSHVENEEVVEVDSSKTTTLPVSQSRQSIKSLLKSDKSDKDRTVYSRIIEDVQTEHRSPNITDTKGPNPALTHGPNNKLLLEDYVNWHGPNTTFRKGPQAIQKGPNRSLLGNRSYQPRGSNAELCKGPKLGLAKGSIFSQLKSVAVGESRGK